MDHIDICNQPLYFVGTFWRTIGYVGRNADVCDIVPEHPSLSRIHAVIQLGKGGRIEIMDFKSTHGTFVNGVQIKPFVGIGFSLENRVIHIYTLEISSNLEVVCVCIP